MRSAAVRIDDLIAFIAAVLGKRVLCRSADPLDALQIAIFGDGDELGWHFDNSEFSVTVSTSGPRPGVISTTEATTRGGWAWSPRCADECLEGFVECIACLGGGVASAGDVGPLGPQPGRQGIADGLEGGAVIARDYQLGK